MSVIDVKKRSSFIIESNQLVSEELLPSCKIKGDYLETYAITPIIFIDKKKIRNRADIFKIILRKKIYDQIFVLACIYLYLDDT